MKNKGFTLVELLGVIVLLAAIFIIVTPILVGIIDKNRITTNKRCVEEYMKTIITSQMNQGVYISDGIYASSFLDSKINIDYDGRKVSCESIEYKDNNIINIGSCYVEDELLQNDDGVFKYNIDNGWNH